MASYLELSRDQYAWDAYALGAAMFGMASPYSLKWERAGGKTYCLGFQVHNLIDRPEIEPGEIYYARIRTKEGQVRPKRPIRCRPIIYDDQTVMSCTCDVGEISQR